MSILKPTPSIPREILEEQIGCRVLSYTIEDGSKPGDNFLSVLYSVSAIVEIPTNQVSSTKEEKRHYLLKCYPRHPARQPYLNKTNLFYNELSFYTVWVKALVDFQTDIVGLPKEQVLIPSFPPCVGGRAVDFVNCDEEARLKAYNSLDNFIMMVDLKKTWNYEMMPKTIPLDFDHVRLIFLELAKVHALSWAYRKKVEWDLVGKYPFLKSALGPKDLNLWTKVVQGNCDLAVKTLEDVLGKGNHLSESITEFREKVKKLNELFLYQKEEAERTLWSMHRKPPGDIIDANREEKIWRVIVHGDCWNNNILFRHESTTGKPESVMLLDFQLTREACPVGDMVYLIYSGTTRDFRKAHLITLLQIYLDTFISTCATLKVPLLPDFDMTLLQRKFHRYKIIGFLHAMVILPIALKDDEEEATNLESLDGNAKLDDMFIDAFGKGVGPLYRERLIEVAQEMYDEGVI